MSFRLYESAWVQIEGVEKPAEVHRDRLSPAAFNVEGFQYDIDARALPGTSGAPRLLSILSLQAIREAGLHGHYRPGGAFED